MHLSRLCVAIRRWVVWLNELYLIRSWLFCVFVYFCITFYNRVFCKASSGKSGGCLSPNERSDLSVRLRDNLTPQYARVITTLTKWCQKWKRSLAHAAFCTACCIVVTFEALLTTIASLWCNKRTKRGKRTHCYWTFGCSSGEFSASFSRPRFNIQ
jgi:hypothetical protein